MATSTIEAIAEALDQAQQDKSPIAQFSSQEKFSLEDAYAIQAALIGLRQKRGENIVGAKMGFTSYAKMEQMGVHEMIIGVLTDGMVVSALLEKGKYIHARAEPEICFLLDKDIDETITLDTAPTYVSKLCMAIEIIDSRYKNFKFAIEDVVADNCSSAGYILGEWVDVATSMHDKKVTISLDGVIGADGNTDDILGNPWLSLVEASKLATKYGVALKKGHIVLAGAATQAIAISASTQLSSSIEGFGTIHCEIK